MPAEETRAHHEVESRLKKLEELHQKGLVRAESVQRGISRLKAAPVKTSDGFQGTYEEYEQSKHGRELRNAELEELNALANVIFEEDALDDLNHGSTDLVLEYSDEEEGHTFETPDGFRGTYEDVLKHEQGLLKNFEANPTYVTADGFRGTFDEVAKYEEKWGPNGKPAATDGFKFKGAYQVYEGHAHSLPVKSKHDQDPGAHLKSLVPEKVDFSTAFRMRGHLFDPEKFDQLKDADGYISRLDLKKGRCDGNWA